MFVLAATVDDAPAGSFDAGTSILVLGVLPDDGSKEELLRALHERLKPGAAFMFVDQCVDPGSPSVEHQLDRYAAYARASGVDPQVVELA